MMSILFVSLIASCNALKLAKHTPAIFAAVPRRSDVADGPQPQEGPQSPFIEELQQLVVQENNAGFASRTSDKSFEDRVAAAAEAAREDPCKADLLANGFGYPWGFGSRAGLAADEIQLAAYFNKSVALCDGDSYQDGIDFEDYFESPIGICKDADLCFAGRTAAPFIGCGFSQMLRTVDYEYVVYLKRVAYQSMFGTLTAETELHISAALEAAGLQPGSKYVGVHMRRGDKSKELKRNHKVMNTTEEYASIVLEELSSNGLTTVYLASDDSVAKDELLDALRPSLPEVQVIQQFSAASAERSYAGDSEGTLEFLVDLVALRDATIFVGTQSSSAGRLVYFLREESEKSISADGGWLDNEEFI